MVPKTGQKGSKEVQSGQIRTAIATTGSDYQPPDIQCYEVGGPNTQNTITREMWYLGFSTSEHHIRDTRPEHTREQVPHPGIPGIQGV